MRDTFIIAARIADLLLIAVLLAFLIGRRRFDDFIRGLHHGIQAFNDASDQVTDEFRESLFGPPENSDDTRIPLWPVMVVFGLACAALVVSTILS